MKHLGEWIFDQRGRVVVAAFLLTLAALPFAGTVFDIAKQGGFDDPTSEAGHVETFLAEHEIGFPNADDLVLVIESPEARIQSVPIALEIRKLISAAIADPMVSRVTSRESLIKPDGLDAEDDMATLVLIAMRGTDDEKRTYYKEVLGPKLRSEIVQVRHSGLIPGNVELTETVVRDLRRAELIALPVTLVALLVLFGGIVPALLPIVIAGISLALSWGLTRILGQWIDISVLALTPMSMLALGVAIDYSLFVVLRYREEMARLGDDVRAAVGATSATAGRAVLLSGTTTAISLASLFIFNEMFLRSVALGTVLAVFTGVVVATLLLPALISTLGSAARWPAPSGARALPRRVLRLAGRQFDSFVRHDQSQAQDSGFWFRISRFGARWPLPLVTVVVLVLLLFGLPFLRINLTLPGEESFPSRFEARQASAVIDDRFSDFERETVDVIMAFDEGAPRDRYDDIDALVSSMSGVAGVTNVDTFTTRLMKEEVDWQQSSDPRENITQIEETIRLFTDGSAVWVRVSIEPGETTAEARAIVQELRALPGPSDATIQFGGGAAALVDARDTLRAKVPIVVAYIVAVTLLALFIEFRSVLIPLKAVLLNAISIAAALGALVFVFQDGNLQGILRFEESTSIATAVPVLVFAIVFGLSMDYEIFLLSRIREEYDANGGDTAQAVSYGLQRTGRMITGAALLIVLVIAAFATSEIVIMKQIGVGLALAILIDATIVRALLVPASMQLLGPANWWAPRWLRRREAPPTDERGLRDSGREVGQHERPYARDGHRSRRRQSAGDARRPVLGERGGRTLRHRSPHPDRHRGIRVPDRRRGVRLRPAGLHGSTHSTTHRALLPVRDRRRTTGVGAGGPRPHTARGASRGCDRRQRRRRLGRDGTCGGDPRPRGGKEGRPALVRQGAAEHGRRQHHDAARCAWLREHGGDCLRRRHTGHRRRARGDSTGRRRCDDRRRRRVRALPDRRRGLRRYAWLTTRRYKDPAHASRPFDRDRDGFAPGEGAGILVLESLDHARARGATVLAEVLGYGVSADASHLVAPAEAGEGAAHAITSALTDACVAAEEIDYISAHATSTTIGDLAETRAIKIALGEHAYRTPVSAMKSQIGHLLGGAGGVETVGAVQSLITGEITPTVNLEHPGEKCDLDYVPNEARRIPVRTVLKNSFAFGGVNAALVIRSAEAVTPRR